MQIQVQDNCLRVQGAVTVQTLTAANHKQFIQQCQQPQIDTLDLSGVVRADSASIALLLAALRLHRSGSLKFIGLPESVADLAQLYEIETWLDSH